MEFIRSSLKKYRHYYRGVRDKAVRRGDSELDSTWWWFSASDSGSWTASCQRWLCDAETIACPPGEAGKLTPARPGLLLVPPPPPFHLFRGGGGSSTSQQRHLSETDGFIILGISMYVPVCHLSFSLSQFFLYLPLTHLNSPGPSSRNINEWVSINVSYETHGTTVTWNYSSYWD